MTDQDIDLAVTQEHDEQVERFRRLPTADIVRQISVLEQSAAQTNRDFITAVSKEAAEKRRASARLAEEAELLRAVLNERGADYDEMVACEQSVPQPSRQTQQSAGRDGR
jgi:hypothetical protein